MSNIESIEGVSELRALSDAELDAVNGGNLIDSAVKAIGAFMDLFRGDLPPQDCWVNWDGFEVCRA